MITENLQTLKIHKLTQSQYDKISAEGTVDQTAFYLTPNDYAERTKGSLSLLVTTTSGTKTTAFDGSGDVSVALAGKDHIHTIANITNLQSTLDGKAPISHTHNYLPLTGGTLSGGITLSATGTTEMAYISKNSSRTGRFTVSSTGRLGIYDNTNSKWLLYSETSGDTLYTPSNINVSGTNSKIGVCTFATQSAIIEFSNTTRAFFKVGNSSCAASFVAASDGYVGLNDSKNNEWIICTYNDGTIYLGHSYKLVIPTADTVGIRPNVSNKCSCGHSSYLWTAVYAKTSSIQTSDIREKDILDKNLEDFSDMFMAMKPVAFRWKSGFGSDVISFGIAAQDTVKCFEDAGYDYQEYNMIHHDELETPSEFGHTERYSASYNDVHMLTMMQTQKNTRELESLRVENAELKQRLEKLEKLLV